MGRHRYWLLSLALVAVATTVRADPLVGDVAAAYSTPEAAIANPANAAYLDHYEFFYAAEGPKDETVVARYPNFKATTLHMQGLSAPLAKPVMFLPLTPRFAIGGFYLPAVPVTIAIQKQNIPVILLNNQTYSDVSVKANVLGFGEAFIAYRLSDNVGIGAGVDMQSIALIATLTESGSHGAPFATLKGTQTDINVTLGARVKVVQDLASVGFAATVASEHQRLLTIQSSLAAGKPLAAAQSASSPGQGFQMLTGVLGGVHLVLGRRLHLMGDLKYTKGNKEQQGFSLVALKAEPQDLHDTVGFRGGLILHATSQLSLLGGLRYEPSTIGNGASADPASIGFGTINLIEVLAGLYPMTPYYMISGGMQLRFLPSYPEARRPGHAPRAPYYRLSLQGGLSYTYSSIGIPASGELPGAYTYRKVAVPIGLSFKF